MGRIAEFFQAIVMGLIIGCAFGIFLVLLFVENRHDQTWQQQIIERGYGLYCPATGDFAWKGECDE